MSAGAIERGLVPPTRPEGFGPPDMLRTIVTHPRATMRWILDHGDGGLWVLLLAAGLLAQCASLATTALKFFAAPSFPAITPAMAISIVVGLCVVGAASYAGSTIVGARLVGGVATPGETLRAVAWGGLPMVAALPYVLASRWLDPNLLPAVVIGLRALVYLLALLSSVLTVLTIAEANLVTWQRSLMAIGIAVGVGVTAAVVLGVVFAIVQNVVGARFG